MFNLQTEKGCSNTSSMLIETKNSMHKSLLAVTFLKFYHIVANTGNDGR